MNHDRRRSLAADSDRFRLLVEQSAIGIEQVSLEARVLEANDALHAMLGYPSTELRSKSLAEIARTELGKPAVIVVSAAILFIVEETQCLSCARWSPHSEWYEQ